MISEILFGEIGVSAFCIFPKFHLTGGLLKTDVFVAMDT